MSELHSEVMVFKTPAVNTPMIPEWTTTDTGIKRFWEMTAAEREAICTVPKWVWIS